jgi:hypothetical protein
LRIADCKLLIADFGLLIANCGPDSYRELIANCGLRMVQLPIFPIFAINKNKFLGITINWSRFAFHDNKRFFNQDAQMAGK